MWPLYSKITAMFIGMYNESAEKVVVFLCNTVVPLNILYSVYLSLVNDGTIKKIESITKEEKLVFFSLVKKLSTINDKELYVKVCSVVYMLNFLSKNI